jgi:hypothetical protein
VSLFPFSSPPCSAPADQPPSSRRALSTCLATEKEETEK